MNEFILNKKNKLDNVQIWYNFDQFPQLDCFILFGILDQLLDCLKL